jgi:carbon-monoxide dehydrogenase small subunit
MKQPIGLRVNGEDYEVFVEPWKVLSEVLREELDLTGVKEGCQTGECGACTVILDGRPVRSCMMLVNQAKGKEILTIEGLASDGQLHPIQQAFIDHFAVQCGFCIPGVILTAKAFLGENPAPTEGEVREVLAGNLCRCTGYVKIVEAVLAAAEVMRKEGK